MLSDFTNALHLGLLFITLFTGSLFYFRIASHFGIVTRPDSDFPRPVVRGGGLILVLTLYCWFALYRLSFPWFMIGVTAIGLVSYASDLKRIRPVIMVAVQTAAFAMIMHHTGMLYQSLWLVVILFIVGVGALNGFNFMSGIHGMVGVYALANLVSFYYINNHIIHFSYSSMIVFMIVGVIVFLFFNFRDRPRCQAGYVGSATLAFVQIFLLLQLIGSTGNFKWALFFTVYGVDVIATILYRLRRGENIFTPHRTHLYQYLVDKHGMSALVVSLLYGVLQLFINIILILFLSHAPEWASVVTVLAVAAGYVWLRVMFGPGEKSQ